MQFYQFVIIINYFPKTFHLVHSMCIFPSLKSISFSIEYPISFFITDSYKTIIRKETFHLEKFIIVEDEFTLSKSRLRF